MVCKDFRVHSVTVGKDAQGEVTVEVEHEGRLYRGRGVSTDSVEASAKAFLNAINRIALGGNGTRRRRRRRDDDIQAEWRNGRRTGFKILWGLTPVRVRVPPRLFMA